MRTITDDVIAVLESGGLTVGDGDGAGLTPPYVVLYPLQQLRDGTLGATAADAWSDIDKAFQVTCEAVSREQAEWLADRVDTVLLSSALLVVPMPRAELARDDTTGGPARWKAYPRYRVRAYAT